MTIKPLVWVEVTSTYWDREAEAEKPSALFWEAETILACGGYQIMQMIDERFRGDKESYSVKLRGKEMKFPTIEAAKAAAQADYEARILAAIEAPDHLALVAAAYRDAVAWMIRAGMAGDAPDDPLASCILARTPADAQAALTAIERAAWERGKAEADVSSDTLRQVAKALKVAERRFSFDGYTEAHPVRQTIRSALALLKQEGR